MHAWRAVVLRDRRVQGADVGVHHQLRRIARMMGDRLGTNEVAAAHAERRRERCVEVSPVNVARSRRQIMQALARSRWFAHSYVPYGQGMLAGSWPAKQHLWQLLRQS